LNLTNRFALAQNHFWNALTHRSMVVDFGVPKVLKGELSQDIQPSRDVSLPVPDIVKEVPKKSLIHAILSPRQTLIKAPHLVALQIHGHKGESTLPKVFKYGLSVFVAQERRQFSLICFYSSDVFVVSNARLASWDNRAEKGLCCVDLSQLFNANGTPVRDPRGQARGSGLVPGRETQES
jgi:hypothetical protein